VDAHERLKKRTENSGRAYAGQGIREKRPWIAIGSSDGLLGSQCIGQGARLRTAFSSVNALGGFLA